MSPKTSSRPSSRLCPAASSISSSRPPSQPPGRPSRRTPWRRIASGCRLGLLAGLLVLASGCAQHVPVEIPFAGPRALVTPIDWDQVFAEPKPIRVIPLFTGEIKVPRGLKLNLEDERIADKTNPQQWSPVLAYLILHETQGPLLLDSGFDSSFARRPGGNFGGLARLVEFTRQAPGGDTISLMRTLGVQPETLKMILLSHMHADHTAGLPELPPSIRLVAGPQAIAGYEKIWYAPYDHLEGWATIEALDFRGADAGGPGPSIDLLGDGSLFAISTPGHTPGNLSFIVNGMNGPVLLTFDASHMREGFESGVGPGKVVDRAAADASVARLKRFAERFAGTLRVIHGHEPTDWNLRELIQEEL